MMHTYIDDLDDKDVLSVQGEVLIVFFNIMQQEK